jgi:transposase
MEQLLSSQAADWREGRRLRAWELHELGWRQQDIAAALGVTQGAVSQWLQRARTGGPAALRRQPPPGPCPKLTPAQLAQLPALLAQGAAAWGFRGEVWTQPRVTELIRQQFGVSYHPSQVGRILKALGWTRQQPALRAAQRDEGAIQTWREQEWPRLQKKLRPKAAP